MVVAKGSRKTVKETKVIVKMENCKNMDTESPYPEFEAPSPEEVARCVGALSVTHGVPERGDQTMSVLDSLVRTILSQNTTDKTSRVAFASLKEHFPTYKAVLEGAQEDVEDSIRKGGLAEIKTKRIKTILATILQDYPSECENGEPSLEFLRLRPTMEVKRILNDFNGVGPKTVSCVLMFNMAREEFPVDTHVWHIAKKLKWVPPSATRESTYEHLNSRVPGPLKYALHVLLVEHGKCCPKCAKGGRLQHSDRAVEKCPLTPSFLKAKDEMLLTPASGHKRVKVEHCTIEGPARVDMAGRGKRVRHLDLQSGLDGSSVEIEDTAVAEAK